MINIPPFSSQVDVAGNRKAVVIRIPYRLRKAYRKIHVRIVRELEKNSMESASFTRRESLYPGKRTLVFLDPKERNNTEYKLESFSAVYRRLSGKDVVFEYPITDA
ncbi:unnamed protein product [Prunus armeniaca]|uniref:40S ribosomal protein S7 n=1 Tax=Prunus armeniaca TaxID=36596 RepID=A0A6J5UAA2_PRUAR|nr:unnamed protein product [Prunus armeniaca]